MRIERWREIEALYHSACERGVAVLEGTDPDIRREVERLLAQDPTGKILDTEAGRILADLAITDETEPGFTMAGHTVQHYEIREMLGAGGMGVVYKAFDRRLNRFVALKFLPPRMRHDHELKRRLADEARAASALDHPNIVVIHDIGEADDLFIAMAFHEGVTLREKIAEGLSLKDALLIARQIASGLARAHEHHISHRDIKPSNVLVAKDGIARIIDFGLAKSTEVTATIDGTTKGTPLYMSPEQAAGKSIDSRTDLWSLGVVLFEMLTGALPFRGETQIQVLRAIIQDEPHGVRDVRPDVPVNVEAIVTRAMQKDPAVRYQSAEEMVHDLSAAIAELDAPRVQRGLRAAYVVAAAAVVVIAGLLSYWFYQRSEKRHWAREQAIPAIDRLRNENKPLAAYRLLRQAEVYLPGDPQLVKIADELTHKINVRTAPAGALVQIKDYLSPNDEWFDLGTAPLSKVRAPAGYFRWRVSKSDAGESIYAPPYKDVDGFISDYDFDLGANARAPQGMVTLPAAKDGEMIWSLGFLGPYDFPEYYMDRYEVTNRQYQEFVDQGGYQKREYWKEKFVRDGKELSWEQSMDLFRDSTERPGPSTWQAGHYPAGQADYPVGGVSWYEAAAYAAWAGKTLPVIAQWYRSAPSSVAKYILPFSNFTNGPAAVGKYQGVGPFGNYDMAGNVAEWCWNEAGGGTRYLLGGGFNTATNEYFEPGGEPPFHRGANEGFRCVRNSKPLPPATLTEQRQTIRDFSKAKPVPDSIFEVYKAMYSYDRTPLEARVEGVVQDSPDWRKEKVSYDAAYGKERITAYLFLPVKVKAPYQTVLFFPSAAALDLRSSDTLADIRFIDFVIQSGRAVLYPVFKGTYERTAEAPGPDTVAGRETLIQDSKDIGRSMDYLETRADIDHDRIAYMGVSMSAALGVIWTALEPRFKAVVFLDGGFYSEKPLKGADQAEFAPRVKAPTLLISGKFDWIFSGKEALLKLFGAPPADKKALQFDTSHDVGEDRPDLIREVVAWLDRYLGKVH